MANAFSSFISRLSAPVSKPWASNPASSTPIYSQPVAKPVTSASPAATNPALQTPEAKQYTSSLANTTAGNTQSSSTSTPPPPITTPPPTTSPSPVSPSPTPTSIPVTDPYSPTAAYTQAFKDYQTALGTNADVSTAQNAYNDFITNQSKSVASLEGRGLGIPLTLIRGQQEKLLNQTNPEATRLQNAISIAQGNQSNTVNSAKAGLDYQTSLADQAVKRAEASKPISVGANSVAYQLNPTTGKYEQVANTGNVAGVGGLSADTTNFWAQAGASGVNLNSLLPSLGMGSAAVATKSALLEKMASNATTLGIDGATFGAMLADSKAKTAAYSTLQKTGSQTQVNEGNANKDFSQVVDLSKKVAAKIPQSGIPILQNWINTGAVKLTGDADVNNFMGVLTTALTEYAKVVSGATTGAGVTEGANAAAQKLLSSGMTPEAIQSFAETAKREMANRTSSYDQALKGLFGNIQSLTDSSGGLGGGGTSPITTPSDSTGGNIFDF